MHVVFGSGQVGPHLIQNLLNDDLPVRVVKRSHSGLPEGVEARLGDATDPAFCRAASEGATAIYHCMNPEYSTPVWTEVLPKLLDNLIAAAGRAGARLIVLDNLYMLGTGDGKPLNESTPVNPCSRKGEIRAKLAERLFAAHKAGDVRAVAGRASDFYGPGGVQTHLGGRFWTPVMKGKAAEFLPNPNNPHTYHFIPDVAEGLKRLGTGPADALGRPWMLPCAPAEPTRALVDRFESELGRSIVMRGIPKPIVSMLGLFVPVIREVKEMLHQWDVPFVVDDTRFRNQFGSSGTDLQAGAKATVQWAREEYGEAASTR